MNAKTTKILSYFFGTSAIAILISALVMFLKYKPENITFFTLCVGLGYTILFLIFDGIAQRKAYKEHKAKDEAKNDLCSNLRVENFGGHEILTNGHTYTTLRYRDILPALLIILTLASCNFQSNAERHFKSDISNIQPAPVSIEYFKKDQVLMPSYACPDTLIVVNAKRLNNGMAYIEQGFIDATDGQIDSILHSNCKLINQ
jgi:hypothetical protein